MICPKCGTEYREGFTQCAYCKIDLVEALPEGVDADELYRRHSEEEALYGTQEGMAAAHSDAAISDEDGAGPEADGADGPIPWTEEELRAAAEEMKAEAVASVGIFRTARSRAEEMQSSGVTLAMVGGLGLFAIVLLALNVFPIGLYGPGRYITFCTMGALFLGFLVVGVRSLRKVKALNEEADREEKQTEEIVSWYKEVYGNVSLHNSGETGKPIQETEDGLHNTGGLKESAENGNGLHNDERLVDSIENENDLHNAEELENSIENENDLHNVEGLEDSVETEIGLHNAEGLEDSIENGDSLHNTEETYSFSESDDYFSIASLMKERIGEKYPDLDPAFLNFLVDRLYTEIYED
ncbi:MAG: zinc ribbon domain-containing protein [Lachnospiraceae bacterium]|nr:zinc ribbon domain-containing protein [Lachnospiraceae bacterium]